MPRRGAAEGPLHDNPPQNPLQAPPTRGDSPEYTSRAKRRAGGSCRACATPLQPVFRLTTLPALPPIPLADTEVGGADAEVPRPPLGQSALRPRPLLCFPGPKSLSVLLDGSAFPTAAPPSSRPLPAAQSCDATKKWSGIGASSGGIVLTHLNLCCEYFSRIAGSVVLRRDATYTSCRACTQPLMSCAVYWA